MTGLALYVTKTGDKSKQIAKTFHNQLGRNASKRNVSKHEREWHRGRNGKPGNGKNKFQFIIKDKSCV